MANSREERYDGSEESEYHFSDDQATYEMEPDTELETEAEAPKAAPAAKPTTAPGGINRYRRMIIAVSVFFVVVFVVYKMIMPNATQSAAEFNEAAAPKAAPKQSTQPVQPVQSAVAAAPQQPPAPPANAQANIPAQPAPQTLPAPPVVATAPTPPVFTAPTTAPVAPPPPPPVAETAQPAMTQAPAPSTLGGVSERLALLEQHNAQMQAENAQKISETQAQTAQMQAKIQEMNSRLASMETNLNQITQALLSKQSPQQLTSATSSMPSTPPPLMKVNEPKVAYSVQAIIPGRAWLKSDAGDTVTVAEGDLLKDYGRITKIDPYDGIVEIDTGAKTVTLSYGTTGD